MPETWRELKQEIRELRQELFRQWEINHSDHCENTWPHAAECHWPPPDLLRLPMRLSGLFRDGREDA
jgi:hypothetical protein